MSLTMIQPGTERKPPERGERGERGARSRGRDRRGARVGVKVEGRRVAAGRGDRRPDNAAEDRRPSSKWPRREKGAGNRPAAATAAWSRWAAWRSRTRRPASAANGPGAAQAVATGAQAETVAGSAQGVGQSAHLRRVGRLSGSSEEKRTAARRTTAAGTATTTAGRGAHRGGNAAGGPADLSRLRLSANAKPQAVSAFPPAASAPTRPNSPLHGSAASH